MIRSGIEPRSPRPLGEPSNHHANTLDEQTNIKSIFCFLCHQTTRHVGSYIILLYIDLRPGQTCYSKDGESCIFRWRGRAWLTIWDRVKIPRYRHKVMHRKRVTCELHDSYFRLMMIKTCHSEDGRSWIFRWQFIGRGWVDVNYYITQCTGSSMRDGEMML